MRARDRDTMGVEGRETMWARGRSTMGARGRWTMGAKGRSIMGARSRGTMRVEDIDTMGLRDRGTMPDGGRGTMPTVSCNVSWVVLPSLVSMPLPCFWDMALGHGDEGTRIPTNRFIKGSRGHTRCVSRGFKPQGHVRGIERECVRGGVVECGGRDKSEWHRAESQWIVVVRPLNHL